MDLKVINKLAKKLGFDKVPDLIIEALTHTSYAHENRGSDVNHNERLEFLGDAVLELIVSKMLYFRYPDLPEGELTKLRASLVCEDALLKIALELNLGRCIRLGKGEEATGGRNRPSILANTVEAVLGAVYLEKGYKHCKNIVCKLMSCSLEAIDRGNYTMDYKTTLQELTQELYGRPPSYNIIKESGPDHSKEFVARIALDDSKTALGKGRSKKEAEQDAAKNLLNKFKDEIT